MRFGLTSEEKKTSYVKKAEKKLNYLNVFSSLKSNQVRMKRGRERERVSLLQHGEGSVFLEI